MSTCHQRICEGDYPLLFFACLSQPCCHMRVCAAGGGACRQQARGLQRHGGRKGRTAEAQGAAEGRRRKEAEDREGLQVLKLLQKAPVRCLSPFLPGSHGANVRLLQLLPLGLTLLLLSSPAMRSGCPSSIQALVMTCHTDK